MASETWLVLVFSIILAVNCASAAEETKIHNFMAKPSGQQATEEVDLVCLAKFSGSVGDFNGLRC